MKAIIVLGCSNQASGLARVEKAVEIHDATAVETPLVVSGRRSVYMVDRTRALGVANCLHEDRSTNTGTNAEYSLALARARGWTRLAIVTSAFHMRRSRLLFERHGPDLELSFHEAPDGATGEDLERYRQKERDLLWGMGVDDPP